MRIIIDLEPGKPEEGILECLRTMIRDTDESRQADPGMECYLELADFCGRALRADVIGVIPPDPTAGGLYRLAAWLTLDEAKSLEAS